MPDHDDVYSTLSTLKYFFICLIMYSLSSLFARGLSSVPEKVSVSVVPTIVLPNHGKTNIILLSSVFGSKIPFPLIFKGSSLRIRCAPPLNLTPADFTE